MRSHPLRELSDARTTLSESRFIAVLDYGIGNLRSAQRALAKVGGDARLISDPADTAGAGGVVLPGVGAFGPSIAALRESGLDAVALAAIEAGMPFLGICVGMQMLYTSSEEDPQAVGLGVFPGAVVVLPDTEKRPQMQWNQLRVPAGTHSAMLGANSEGQWAYFVHSYAPERSPETVAVCDYGGDVVAAVERENVWATQFHPEKSGRFGLGVLARFVERCGS